MQEDTYTASISYSEVAALRESARRRYTRLHAQIETYEGAYRLDYVNQRPAEDEIGVAGMRLPAGTPIHIPSTGPAIVDRFVEQVRTDRPRVEAGTIMRGRNTTERRRALESLATLVMERIAESEDRDVWHNVSFSLALRGCAAVTILFDPDRWPEDTAEQASAWPFVVRTIHPNSLYLPAGNKWPYRWAVEEQLRYYGELREHYPLWLPDNRKDGRPWRDDDVMDILVYWNAKDYCLYADGSHVVSHRNPLGLVPIVFDYAGFGYQSVDDDPATQSLGVLHHSLSELSAEVRLRTMSDALWQSSVWPTLIGTWSAEDMKSSWGAGAGRYIKVNDMQKEKPEWLETTPISPQMLALLPQLKESIERSTYAEALSGLGDPSIRSGVQAGIQVGQARARVDKARNSLERIASRMLTIAAAWYEKEIGVAIKAGGATIKPDDIGGHDRFKVTFVPVDPDDDATRLSNGLALLQARTISVVDFLRDYKRDPDPEGTFERMLAETLVLKLSDAGALDQAIIMNMMTEDRIQAAKNGMARGAAERNRSGDIDRLEQGAPYGPRRAQGTSTGEGPAQYTGAGQASAGQPREGAPNA